MDPTQQEHPEYRLFRLQNMVDEFHLENKVAPADLAPDPGAAAVVDDVNKVRCRKCRRVLVSNRNMLDHNPGDGQVSFRYHKRDGASQSTSSCTSLFVEPMAWMAAELGTSHNEGKVGYGRRCFLRFCL